MLAAGAASMKTPLQEVVERTFRGEHFEGVQVGRHGFDLNPVGLPGPGIVRARHGMLYAKGYFRHRIKGKDDKIFYTIEAREGRAPVGTITAIERNGWWSKIPAIPIPFADSELDAGELGDEVFRRGSWEAAAQQVVDALANRLAEEL